MSSSSHIDMTASHDKNNDNNNDNRHFYHHRYHHHLVRLVVLSDTHNRHKAVHKLLPPRDPNHAPSVLLHCGDFADRGSLQHVRSFCQWLSRPDGLPLHFQHVVVVDGNHDRAKPPATSGATAIDLPAEFAKCNQKIQQYGIQRQVHFLQDSSVLLFGGLLHIYGASWSSAVCDDYSTLAASSTTLTTTHRSVDVLLSHMIPYFSAQERHVAVGPPHPNDDTSCIDFQKWKGSRALTSAALHSFIPLVCCGHVHWGRGAVYIPPRYGSNPNDDSHGTTTGTWFVNASTTKPGYTKYDDESVDPTTQVTAPVIIYYDLHQRCVVHMSCPPH